METRHVLAIKTPTQSSRFQNVLAFFVVNWPDLAHLKKKKQKLAQSPRDDAEASLLEQDAAKS